MSLVCITNEMPDWRSCTVRDAHTVACNGRHYHWIERKQEWQDDGPCTGCLPREARVGMLCYPCWDKVEHAFGEWTPERRRTLLGLVRAVKRDTEGRSGSGPEGYVPIPGTILAVDEVESYLRTCVGDARAWVSTDSGARDAVRFAAAVPRALRTHELEERQRPVRRVRCPACGQLSFVRNPPAGEGQPITVKCENAACGKVIAEGERTPARAHGTGDEEKLTVIAAIERLSQKEIERLSRKERRA